MKPLRPVVILTLGSTAVGAALLAAATLLLPEPPTLRGMISVFAAGVILGILVLGPVIVGANTRSLFVYRHFHALDRWTLFPLGMGAGYLLLRNLGDNANPVAALLAILAGAFRVYLSLQAKRGALEEESFQ